MRPRWIGQGRGVGGGAVRVVELDEEANADWLAEHSHVLCDGLGGERVGNRVLFTHRSLTTPERAGLCSLLLGLSGWRGHADRFPTRYNAGRSS